MMSTRISTTLASDLTQNTVGGQSWLEFSLLAWIMFLAVLPILVLTYTSPAILSAIYIRPDTHALLEAFCGVSALIIAGMLSLMGSRRRDASILLFTLAFVTMGVLDIIHAGTDPDTDLQQFYMLHTWSTFICALLIFCGVLIQTYFNRSLYFSHPLTPLVTLVVAACAVVLIAAIYQITLPRLVDTSILQAYQFPPLIHHVHELSALLYALSGIGFYVYYSSHRYIPALIIGSLLLIFAEAAYLFRFSIMWSMTWWLWHGIKVVFYFSVFFTIAISSQIALTTIERSRAELKRTNSKLRNSESIIQLANWGLRVRNEMIRAAMVSLELNNVLAAIGRAVHELVGHTDNELLVRVLPDEIGEFNHEVALQQFCVPVIAMKSDHACPGVNCSTVADHDGNVLECKCLATTDMFQCISLNADGKEIGHLKLAASEPMTETKLSLLSSIISEAGPLVYNSLMHQSKLEDEEFRSGLLRISFALASTLDLNLLLKSVCDESTRLLKTDGVVLWLLSDDSSDLKPVVHVSGNLNFDPVRLADVRIFDAFRKAQKQREIDRYRPLHFSDGGLHSGDTPCWSQEIGCRCKSFAFFPVLNETNLIGILGFMRLENVRFSHRTLGKGELLSGVTQAAIINIRNYNRLVKLNQQLITAEEIRARNEKLAVLGEMAASVAHELRNPLGAINNCLAVLRRSDFKSDASTATALEIIEDEVHRLDKLAKDFLIFGGAKRATSSSVSVGPLLNRVCAAINHYATHEKLNMSLQSRYLGTSDPILFDADGLEIVLWNLLLNAVQAVPTYGQVNVTIRTMGQKMTLVVKDSGIGISKEDLESIFRPFFSRRAHGAGLGLSIVHRYCQDWKAQIRVISQIGKGTVFVLRIPIQGAIMIKPAYFESRLAESL